MNHCEMMKELDRLLDMMSNMDPTSKEYEIVQKRYNSLFQMFLKESANCDAQLDKKARLEFEKKKFEQSERRFEFEKERFEHEKKRDEVKEQMEYKKYSHDVVMDDFKVSTEEKKLEMEREKLRIEEERVRVEAEESGERSRYTKRQALGRLLEIGAQGLVTMTCIVLTGKMEESAILSSKAFSFIAKPRL